MRFQATLLVFLGGFKIVLVVVELLTHLLYLRSYGENKRNFTT